MQGIYETEQTVDRVGRWSIASLSERDARRRELLADSVEKIDRGTPLDTEKLFESFSASHSLHKGFMRILPGYIPNRFQFASDEMSGQLHPVKFESTILGESETMIASQTAIVQYAEESSTRREIEYLDTIFQQKIAYTVTHSNPPKEPNLTNHR